MRISKLYLFFFCNGNGVGVRKLQHKMEPQLSKNNLPIEVSRTLIQMFLTSINIAHNGDFSQTTQMLANIIRK